MRFHNHKLEVVSKKDLEVIWHPHLELDGFQGRHEKQKEQARRRHIINLVKENTSHASTPEPMAVSPRPSNRKRRRTSMRAAVESSNSDTASASDSNDDDSHASTTEPMAVSPLPSNRKRRRTSMRATVESSNSDTASTSDSNDDSSRASTHVRMVLRPRLTARKSRRTSIEATGDSPKSGALSDIDDYLPSPSRLSDLRQGRQLKKVSNDEPQSLEGTSVQNKRALAYDVQPGRSGRAGGHAINQATQDHTTSHATGARVVVHEANSSRVGEQIMSHKRVFDTILRVSTSDRPSKAPINIPLGNCRSVEEFYNKVLSECATSADAVYDISAVFAWNRRGNLIRKGNRDDWSFFYKQLQRFWERDIDNVTDDTCEVEIMVHIES